MLVDIVKSVVQPGPKPAVYISGGLDSTILLHHLSEVSKEKIYTYTFGFSDSRDEFEPARQVARLYGTVHKEVVIGRLLPMYKKLLRDCSRPLFNLWVYWLADAAAKDKRKTCYAAEGMDEHFGGYWYKTSKSYIESWADVYVYSKPAYELVHSFFDLNLRLPFLNLDIKQTLPYWDSMRQKGGLRDAYKGILPDFVLRRKKQPGRPDWREFWDRELHECFPKDAPQTDEEIKELLNIWVTKVWVDYKLKEVRQ